MLTGHLVIKPDTPAPSSQGRGLIGMFPVIGARGRFVVLVGPDGVGKTSVARALLAHYRGPTTYFHFLPPLDGRWQAEPDPTSVPPPKAHGGGSVILGWIRLVRNAVRCWVGYLKSVRPALKRGFLIVGDRWMYGYVVQPGAMKFHGPDLLARAVLRLLPRPHLIVNLAAPAEVIRGRKQELTLSQIEQELLVWSSLRVPNFKTLDATRTPRDIAIEILAALESGNRNDCVA
jgi:thymidylate kinase